MLRGARALQAGSLVLVVLLVAVAVLVDSAVTPASKPQAPTILSGIVHEARYTQLFREQARLAAERNDFSAFHSMHATLREVVRYTKQMSLLEPPVLNKQIDGVALFHAAFVGHESFVRQYIEGGYPLNATVDILPYMNVWREQRGLADVALQHALAAKEVPSSAVHAAILGGHNELAISLLQSGVAPEGPNGALQPLHLAAMTDNAAMLDVLLTQFASSIDLSTSELSENFTALHFASLYGCTDAMAMLLLNGADPNTNTNPTGRTPLFLAALSNSTDAVALLVNNNASCVIEGADNSIVHIPIAARNLPMLELLLDTVHCNLSIVTPNGETPLHLAVKKNRVDMVELLVSHGADITQRLTNGDTPLHIAAKNNAHESVTYLLEHGAEIEARNNINLTVFLAAVRAQHLRVAEQLLDAGADVDATAGTLTAMELAVINGNQAMASMLIERKHNLALGAPVSLAVMDDNFDFVDLLLDNGAPLDQPHGEALVTPLLVASIYDKSNMISMLLMRGANIAAVDNFGNTPLIRAVFSLAPAALRALISHGADINVKNGRGESALHIACDSKIPNYKPDPEFVRTLVRAGADVDQTNDAGNTPLHTAAIGNDQGVLAALVAGGADLTIRNDDGLTPLELAKARRRDTARVTLLLAEQKARYDPECCFPDDWLKTVSYATKRIQV